LNGEFIEQTVHIVERVRAHDTWEFIDTPLGRRVPRLRTTGAE